MVAAVSAISQRKPIVLGKPNKMFLEVAQTTYVVKEHFLCYEIIHLNACRAKHLTNPCVPNQSYILDSGKKYLVSNNYTAVAHRRKQLLFITVMNLFQT